MNFQNQTKYIQTDNFLIFLSSDGKKGEALKPGNLPDSLKNGGTVIFKKLGIQISWRFVFIMEYLGPLMAFPTIYLLRNFIYPEVKELGQVQLIATALFMIHFLKREFETIFVHKFSNATMPLFGLFRNCMYYYGFALFIAYFHFTSLLYSNYKHVTC